MINIEILKQPFHSKSQEHILREYQSDPETIPPASKEKAEEPAGHKKDEMPKEKGEDPNEPPPATKADKL